MARPRLMLFLAGSLLACGSFVLAETSETPLPGHSMGESHGEQALTGDPMDMRQAFQTSVVRLPDIHGLVFSDDASRLVVPAHDGLRFWSAGNWLSPPLPVHDYMGFAATSEGFYTSGHPSQGSGYSNPLGLAWLSADGRELSPLAFSGQVDFHLLAAGYHDQAVYIFTEEPRQALSAGLHYSLDRGKTWRRSAARGMRGTVTQLAVHPKRVQTVAAVAGGLLYISHDHGNRFLPIDAPADVSAAAFSPDGRYLFFGGSALARLTLETEAMERLPAPPFSPGDSASFLAVSPNNAELVAVASRQRDIYISENSGRTWRIIARQGVGM